MQTYIVTVKMNREESGRQYLDGYRPEHPLDDIGRWVIEADSPEAAAEVMFEMGNLRNRQDMFGRGWPRTERSLSVGDVLMLDVAGGESRTVLSCDRFGWGRL